jgi:saccharopine dehydrogenase (NAD+, L-lysine-forming)
MKINEIGNPAYIYNPITQQIQDGEDGDGIVVGTVDNLPAELPIDSSTFFSNQLTDIMPSIINADFSASLEDSGIIPAVKKAIIVYNGKLTEDYKYLQEYLEN